jgi:hypothetical protein
MKKFLFLSGMLLMTFMTACNNEESVITPLPVPSEMDGVLSIKIANPPATTRLVGDAFPDAQENTISRLVVIVESGLGEPNPNYPGREPHHMPAVVKEFEAAELVNGTVNMECYSGKGRIYFIANAPKGTYKEVSWNGIWIIPVFTLDITAMSADGKTFLSEQNPAMLLMDAHLDDITIKGNKEVTDLGTVTLTRAVSRISVEKVAVKYENSNDDDLANNNFSVSDIFIKGAQAAFDLLNPDVSYPGMATLGGYNDAWKPDREWLRTAVNSTATNESDNVLGGKKYWFYVFPDRISSVSGNGLLSNTCVGIHGKQVINGAAPVDKYFMVNLLNPGNGVTVTDKDGNPLTTNMKMERNMRYNVNFTIKGVSVPGRDAQVEVKVTVVDWDEYNQNANF